MFTYQFWAKSFILAGLVAAAHGNNDNAILFTNIAIVLAILETAKKDNGEKEE